MNFRARLNACGIHLLLCLLIATTVLLFVFFVWYPAPLSKAQGIDAILLILFGVDVLLGPLITLILFNPRKKSLKFDLAVIAVVQLCALLYGLHTVFAARPAYVVFNVDRFDVVTALDVDAESAKRAQQVGRSGPSLFGPEFIAAKLPTDPEAHNKILFSSMQGGPDLPQLPEYYVDYSAMRDTVLANAKPLLSLKRLNTIGNEQWQTLLSGLGHAEAELGYLPLRGKERDGAVVINRHDGSVVKMLLLTPW